MRKLVFIILGFFFSALCFAAEIQRIEPAFWWTGMKNCELQIMVYGPQIANSTLQFDYPGVNLKETVRTGNPNYLFLYLDITPEANAGTIKLKFTEGKKTISRDFELRRREHSAGAQGFSTDDVLYLIMPDRFANGDPANDVWDGEPINRADQYARHGGDFAGIEQHLNYLKDLGITAVWLNPVLENRMYQAGYQGYHGYAITDFYAVDRRFGTNEDYRALIGKIHEKGMKMVMDMVFNHCGILHWWMNDLPATDWLNNQQKPKMTTGSMYSLFDPHSPQTEIDAYTDGWFVESMPDLNQRNRLLSKYLIQNSIWWIEYARIDGIRHDTHPYADFDFLTEWCKEVMDEYPDFNIVGETWYSNPAPLAWWQRNSKINTRQTNLKTVMDFALNSAVQQAFTTDENKDFDLRKIQEILAQDFLYADPDNILVLLDNHDMSRFPKKGETDLRRFRQAMAFLLTTRGIPQIYYGDEILMYGEKEEGDGLLRKDFPGGWQGDARNAFTKTGRTALENEAFDFLKKLLHWRQTSEAVKHGKLIQYAPEWGKNCYVYARRAESGKTVLVILNGSQKEQTLPTARYSGVIGSARSGVDAITGQSVDLQHNITVPAKGTLILDVL
ncbi:MAG: glycoside hydrolase family 13 protein [Dysgonamonadaceae bacterium]|jgi:glycosidase|nr:glycoside hydrolase family 13 protein [Dysgonamonadaceae bacterium]